MSGDDLHGAWTLISCEHRHEDGRVVHPWGETATGLILYTPDGHMSAFVMRSGRAPFAQDGFFDGTPPEMARAMAETLCYAGRYRVEKDQVFHILDLSLFPNWTSTEQPRYFRVEKARLTLTSHPFSTREGVQTAVIKWKRP